MYKYNVCQSFCDEASVSLVKFCGTYWFATNTCSFVIFIDDVWIKKERSERIHVRVSIPEKVKHESTIMVRGEPQSEARTRNVHSVRDVSMQNFTHVRRVYTYQSFHEGAQFLRDHCEFKKCRADVRFLFLQSRVAESLQRSAQVHLIVYVGCKQRHNIHVVD